MTALRDKPERLMTLDEYLAFEEQADERHEFEDGHLYAMSGETLGHEDIVLNVTEALRPIARERGYRFSIKTIKLCVSSSKFFYPDVFITRQPARNDSSFLENACFVLEVLSPSTAWRDRGVKQDAYLEMPSLERYVVVNPNERHVAVFSRTIKGWMYETFNTDGEIEIPCLETKLSLEQIYAGIEVANHS
jgi:Uma2 family endonuclease